jgi:trigger factor
VKVETKDISETRKQLIVTFEAAEVDQELARVTGEIARQVRLPGFRPGHVPVAIIRKRFETEITGELKQAIVARAYRDGLKEAKLDPIQLVELPEQTVTGGQPATITITVDINPKFDLPEYKGLEVKALDTSVKDSEVEDVIEQLRRERAEFKTVERAAEQGDYVKFGFEGEIDGKKIAELVPERPIYGTMPQTWEEAGAEEGLLPGAGKHLVGLKAGDAKDVDIDFPAEFAIPQLAGKRARYKLTVQEVRQRVLPEIDEAFLKAQNAATLDELRVHVRASLTSRKEAEDRAERRRQAADVLAAKVEFPIPESLIEGETDVILRQLVEGNVRRGVPQEELEKSKEELYASARKAAIGRTKVRMLLMRVAGAEKLKVTADDLNHAVYREAMRSNQKPDKVAKDLGKDRDKLQVLQQNVLLDKALDFLVDQATVTPA